MKINEQLILKLEKLARLELSAPERHKMQADLEKILGMCDKLMEVDTEGVEPLIYMGAKEQKARLDNIRGMLSQQEALENAPEKEGPYFKVPKVVK